MTRGDIVVFATKGAYSGKPRPALVVQSDAFNDTHASLTVNLQSDHDSIEPNAMHK